MGSTKKLYSVIIAILFFTLLGIFPKQETLKCDKVKNNCTLVRANYYNVKSEEVLPSFSSISSFYYQKKYRRKRSDYYNIMIELNNGSNRILFNKNIKSKADAETIIDTLNSEFLSNNPKVEYIIKTSYLETIFN